MPVRCLSINQTNGSFKNNFCFPFVRPVKNNFGAKKFINLESDFKHFKLIIDFRLHLHYCNWMFIYVKRARNNRKRFTPPFASSKNASPKHRRGIHLKWFFIIYAGAYSHFMSFFMLRSKQTPREWWTGELTTRDSSQRRKQREMFLFVGYAMALEIIPIFLYDDAWRDAL